MFATLGIVQPRRGSLSHVARKLGGKSLLEWVVRNVTDCQRLDRVVVLVGLDTDERVLADLAPPDVPVFVGQGPDTLSCFVQALDAFPAHNLVRIFADNPYTDPVLIDRLVKTADEHPECDYISYCFRDDRPAIMSPVGVLGEWCRGEALRRAAREARLPLDREHVTQYLFSHPERFSVRLIPAPVELDREDVRLTIDSEEDWEQVQAMYDCLGPVAFDWRRIAEMLDSNPALRGRVAASEDG